MSVSRTLIARGTGIEAQVLHCFAPHRMIAVWRLSLDREAGCLVMSLRGATIDGYGSTRYVVRYKGADWPRIKYEFELRVTFRVGLGVLRIGPHHIPHSGRRA